MSTKDSVTIAVLPEGAPAPSRVERLSNDLAKLRRFRDRLAMLGELRACYEASGAGGRAHAAISAKLNRRPRKRLGYRTPEECYVP